MFKSLTIPFLPLARPNAKEFRLQSVSYTHLEIGMFVSIRNDGNLKSILRRVTNGQTHTVHRNRAFVHRDVTKRIISIHSLSESADNIQLGSEGTALLRPVRKPDRSGNTEF